MQTISNLGAYIKEKDREREEIEKATAEFLKWKHNKIEVLPPCMPPSIPEPGPITIRFNQRKKPQVDRRKIGVDKDKVEWKYSADTNSAILDGHKFGKLTALYAMDKRAGDRQKIWLCACDCGRTAEVVTVRLTRKIQTDCGRCDEPQIDDMGEVLERYKEREGATA